MATAGKGGAFNDNGEAGACVPAGDEVTSELGDPNTVESEYVVDCGDEMEDADEDEIDLRKL